MEDWSPLDKKNKRRDLLWCPPALGGSSWSQSVRLFNKNIEFRYVKFWVWESTFDIEPGGVLHIAGHVDHLRPAGQLRLVEVPGGGEEDGAHHGVTLSLRLQEMM